MGTGHASEVMGSADRSPSARPRCPVASPASDSARAVYEHILRFGPRPRTELAERLELSGTTLTRVTRSLLEDDLLRELAPWPRSKGRPQQPLDIDEDHAHFIGLKIIPQAVLAAVITTRGVVLEEISEPLSAHRPDDVLAAGVRICQALIAAHPRVAGIGVGIGGRVDAVGTVTSSRMLDWRRPVPFAQALQTRIALPVSVTNDFRGLLHGLNWFDIGRRYSSFVLLTIGQGVGVGMVDAGEVHEGRAHVAGLAGNLQTITRDGRGVLLHDVATNEAVLGAARAAGVLTPREGLPELLASVRDGKGPAREIAAEVSHVVQVAAAGLIGVIDPEALVLGGESVELLGPPEAFATALRARLDPQQRDITVRRLPPDFDDWARGAAVVALRRFIAGG